MWLGITLLLVSSVHSESVKSQKEKLNTSSQEKSKDKILQQKFLDVKEHIESGNTSNINSSDSNIIKTKSATGLFFKMLFGMVFIILLIILCIRWLKKLQKSPLLGKKKMTTNKMEVLETCYLGKDQKVILMSIGDKEVVLGVTSGSIQYLKEMNGSLINQEPIAQKVSSNERELFTENLTGFLSKYSRPKTVSESLKEL